MIIGFSGKKQSGKNTCCNYIVGLYLGSLSLVDGSFNIDQHGKLHISDLWGDSRFRGEFDILRQSETMDRFKEDFLNEHIKVYSFADKLKKNICMDLLGLTLEQCYGTDEQKNSLTHLKWEDMPGVVTPDFEDKFGNVAYDWDLIPHKEGFMTAREVMQFVGTDVFRKMYSKVWVNATINQIKQDNPYLALICDVRFPDEIEGIHKAGGKVGRLLRNNAQDQHNSERSLDDYTNFDWTWDNRNTSIEELCDMVYEDLQTWLPKQR